MLDVDDFESLEGHPEYVRRTSMNPNPTNGGAAQDHSRPVTNWRRASVTTACMTLLVVGLAACNTGAVTSSPDAVPLPDESALVTSTLPPAVTTTTGPPTTNVPPTTTSRPTTTVAVAETQCRTETAPNGADAYGVTHNGERICTWGPELRFRLDSNGFVRPAQNHSVDIAMAERCWSAGGRVYLRTPASNGWACIGGTPPTTTPPTPPALSASSTLALHGLGPVRIGMTLDEASAAAGTPIEATGARNDSCFYARPTIGPEGVSFMLVSGRIARVDVTAGQITTLSGAAIGDTEAEVQALYSGQLQVSPHKYLAAGRYLTLVPSSAADSDFRLIFETDGSAVTRFRAGTQPEVSFVEGCS